MERLTGCGQTFFFTIQAQNIDSVKYYKALAVPNTSLKALNEDLAYKFNDRFLVKA